MTRLVGHIIDFDTATGVEIAAATVVTWIVAAFAIMLFVEHQVVKHGRAGIGRLRRNVGLGIFVALVVGLAPAPAISQDRELPAGLPDLISDPPMIWFDKIVEYPDGSLRKVIAFDGFLHNIGDGVLDLAGNPQIEGGVRQRVWDGEEWSIVGEPSVLYEITDGHNHFHLMAAAEYTLWDEPRLESVGDSAKVGFCLVDTEQREDRHDLFYDINDPDLAYCQQYHPEATDLRMGITPGWVDTYDANTTLQWVDVSNIDPGRYWVGALIDPLDQIVESDEANNVLTWSLTSFPVTGYSARSLDRQVAGEPIQLKADIYGHVGDVRWKITRGPSNGQLSVPAGVDFRTDVITYVPNPGFTGTDTFSYSAADVDSAYPLEPREVEVHIDASSYRGAPADETAAPAGADQIEVRAPDRLTGETFRPVAETVAVEDPANGATDGTASTEQGDASSRPVRWYADDLPSGVAIDRDTGAISGTPTEVGEGIGRVVAEVGHVAGAGVLVEAQIPWEITEGVRPSLETVSDFSTVTTEEARIRIGEGTRGARYTATGLPDGIHIVENLPILAGWATLPGWFEVEVTETIDGVETAHATFVWVVRPTARPAFPL